MASYLLAIKAAVAATVVSDGFEGGDCVVELVIDLTFAESAHAFINYPIS